MTYMATPQRKNPCPRRHEIYNLGRNFLCHHYYILRFLIYASEERRRCLKGIMHFHYMTSIATPERKNPCPGGHEIYNLDRPFLGHHYYKLFLSDLYSEVEKNIFKEIPGNAFSIHKLFGLSCHKESIYGQLWRDRRMDNVLTIRLLIFSCGALTRIRVTVESF